MSGQPGGSNASYTSPSRENTTHPPAHPPLTPPPLNLPHRAPDDGSSVFCGLCNEIVEETHRCTGSVQYKNLLTYKCRFCPMGFQAREILYKHMQHEHFDMYHIRMQHDKFVSAKRKEKIHTCPECTHQRPYKWHYLMEHIRKYHANSRLTALKDTATKRWTFDLSNPFSVLGEENRPAHWQMPRECSFRKDSAQSDRERLMVLQILNKENKVTSFPACFEDPSYRQLKRAALRDRVVLLNVAGPPDSLFHAVFASLIYIDQHGELRSGAELRDQFKHHITNTGVDIGTLTNDYYNRDYNAWIVDVERGYPVLVADAVKVLVSMLNVCIVVFDSSGGQTTFSPQPPADTKCVIAVANIDRKFISLLPRSVEPAVIQPPSVNQSTSGPPTQTVGQIFDQLVSSLHLSTEEETNQSTVTPLNQSTAAPLNQSPTAQLNSPDFSQLHTPRAAALNESIVGQLAELIPSPQSQCPETSNSVEIQTHIKTPEYQLSLSPQTQAEASNSRENQQAAFSQSSTSPPDQSYNELLSRLIPSPINQSVDASNSTDIQQELLNQAITTPLNLSPTTSYNSHNVPQLQTPRASALNQSIVDQLSELIPSPQSQCPETSNSIELQPQIKTPAYQLSLSPQPQAEASNSTEAAFYQSTASPPDQSYNELLSRLIPSPISQSEEESTSTEPTFHLINQPNFQPPNQSNPQQNIQPTFQPPNQSTPQQNIQTTFQPPNQSTPQQNMQPTFQPHIQSTPQQNIQPFIQPHIQSTPQQNIQPTFQPPVQSNPQQNIQQFIQPHVQSTPRRNIQPTFQPPVQSTLQQNIQPFIQQQIQSNHPQNIQLFFQPPVESTRRRNIQPTFQPPNQSTPQQIIQPTFQPPNQPTPQQNIQPTFQPTNQPTPQQNIQPTFNPPSQSTPQLLTQPTFKLPSYSTPQPRAPPTAQPPLQSTPQSRRPPTFQSRRPPTSQQHSQSTLQPLNRAIFQVFHQPNPQSPNQATFQSIDTSTPIRNQSSFIQFVDTLYRDPAGTPNSPENQSALSRSTDASGSSSSQLILSQSSDGSGFSGNQSSLSQPMGAAMSQSTDDTPSSIGSQSNLSQTNRQVIDMSNSTDHQVNNLWTNLIKIDKTAPFCPQLTLPPVTPPHCAFDDRENMAKSYCAFCNSIQDITHDCTGSVREMNLRCYKPNVCDFCPLRWEHKKGTMRWKHQRTAHTEINKLKEAHDKRVKQDKKTPQSCELCGGLEFKHWESLRHHFLGTEHRNNYEQVRDDYHKRWDFDVTRPFAFRGEQPADWVEPPECRFRRDLQQSDKSRLFLVEQINLTNLIDPQPPCFEEEPYRTLREAANHKNLLLMNVEGPPYSFFHAVFASLLYIDYLGQLNSADNIRDVFKMAITNQAIETLPSCNDFDSWLTHVEAGQREDVVSDAFRGVAEMLQICILLVKSSEEYAVFCPPRKIKHRCVIALGNADGKYISLLPNSEAREEDRKRKGDGSPGKASKRRRVNDDATTSGTQSQEVLATPQKRTVESSSGQVLVPESSSGQVLVPESSSGQVLVPEWEFVPQFQFDSDEET